MQTMEEIDLSTASNMEANTSPPPPPPPDNEPLPEVPGEGSSVLTLHPAALYEMYTNFTDGLSTHVKTRVMRFMRHELNNNNRNGDSSASGEGRDVEGGSMTRASNVTYDSLIFKVTILLGFVLQFPVMWVAGGVLFLASSNFKASTVKWGCLNFVLAVLSVVYVVNQWQIRTEVYMDLTTSGETLVFESGRIVEPWQAIIHSGETAMIIKPFVFSANIKWIPFNKEGTTARSAPVMIGKAGKLVDPKTVSGDHMYYCAKGDDIVVGGWIQIGATFSNTKVTKREVSASRHNTPGKLPVVYNPHDTMIFDIGLKCLTDDLTHIFIGINATRENEKSSQSEAFFIPGVYTCSLAYSTTGSKPTVHSAYIKAL